MCATAMRQMCLRRIWQDDARGYADWISLQHEEVAVDQTGIVDILPGAARLIVRQRTTSAAAER